MKKKFILSEEEKQEIINLYSEKNIVIEQEKEEKPVTIKDIQDKLVELGYEEMLGKFGADGKFGKMTLSAISKAIDDKVAYQQRIQPSGETVKTKDAAQVGVLSTTKEPSLAVRSQPASLITPKTEKSEWCMQNVKREDEDCFIGKSMDYQTARSEANRAARSKGYGYKRAETPKDQNPYYAIYATQPLSEYEKNKSKMSQGQKTTTTSPLSPPPVDQEIADLGNRNTPR